MNKQDRVQQRGNVHVLWKRWCAAMLLAAGLFFAGCENDDDEFDHDAPSGQGTVIVNNLTSESLAVYISGIRQDKNTDSDDYEWYDRDPGRYSVTLNGRDSNRSWFGRIEVLEGRQTILDVYGGYIASFDVNVRLND